MIHLIILVLFSIGLIIFLSLLDRQRANVMIFYVLVIIVFIPFKYMLPYDKSFLVNDILILFTFLYYSIKNARIRKKFDRTFSHLLILIILFGIGLIYSIFISSNFQSFSSYYYSYYLSIRLLVIYYLYFNLIEDHNYYKRLFLIVNCIAFTASIYLLYEFLINYNAPSFYLEKSAWDTYHATLSSSWKEGSLLPWLGGTNGRSKLLLLFFSFILSIRCFTRGTFFRLFRIVNLFFITLAIVIQFSKSAYVFYFIIILVYLYFSFEIKLKGVVNFSFVFLLTFFFYNAVIENEIAMDRIDSAMTEKVSSTSRTMLVIDGLDYAKQNYYLGNGFESVRLNKNYLKLHYPKLGMQNTHNTFLEILIDVGFMGLFVFIIFLKRIVYNSSSLIKWGLNQLRNNFGLIGYTTVIIFTLSALVGHGLLRSSIPFGPLFIIIIAAVNKLKILPEITNNKAHNYSSMRS